MTEGNERQRVIGGVREWMKCRVAARELDIERRGLKKWATTAILV